MPLPTLELIMGLYSMKDFDDDDFYFYLALFTRQVKELPKINYDDMRMDHIYMDAIYYLAVMGVKLMKHKNDASMKDGEFEVLRGIAEHAIRTLGWKNEGEWPTISHFTQGGKGMEIFCEYARVWEKIGKDEA